VAGDCAYKCAYDPDCIAYETDAKSPYCSFFNEVEIIDRNIDYNCYIANTNMQFYDQSFQQPIINLQNQVKDEFAYGKCLEGYVAGNEHSSSSTVICWKPDFTSFYYPLLYTNTTVLASVTIQRSNFYLKPADWKQCRWKLDRRHS
jgi:hypothetical protein